MNEQEIHTQLAGLAAFIANNWLLLLLIVMLILLMFTVIQMRRSQRQLEQWMETSRFEDATAQHNLDHLLLETREHIIKQVEEGQRAGQEALWTTSERFNSKLEHRFGQLMATLSRDQGALQTQLVERMENYQHQTAEALASGKFQQQQHLTAGIDLISQQVNQALLKHGESLGTRVHQLMESTDQRLKEISGQVDQRLSEGFEKTTQTFTRVLEHLTRIDEAQKKLTELSSNVVSLQELLSDKRSRGAFGEMQLSALVDNLLPKSHYALQETLTNGTRVDCLLKLPEPTGNVAVDAKFPLESFQLMTDIATGAADRQKAARQFKQDIKKHINDIASKYIIHGVTADGAMMFIPAEAVFAEIHAHHPELVNEAQRKSVWLVSPTTMMAVLTTARAVLRDAATQKQVHVIRDHLHALSRDFMRFQQRMDKLSRHIAQAHEDVNAVHKSAQSITNRFEKIDQVDIKLTPPQDAKA